MGRLPILTSLLLLVLTSANAQTESRHFIRFQTYPSEVEVYQQFAGKAQDEYLGLATDKCGVLVPSDRSQRVRLVFRHSDFRNEERDFGATELNKYSVYPQPIRLEPNSAWLAIKWWARSHTVPIVVLSAVVLSGAFFLIRWRKDIAAREARIVDFEKLEADVGTEGGSLSLQMVGNLRLAEVLGRGGMGIVYRGIAEMEKSKTCAVKILDAKLSKDPELRGRFEREIKVCSMLSHPNIVRIDDWGEHEGRLFLSMEHLEGGTLKERLEAPLSLATFETYIIPLMKAVHYAHQKGVVHRDLKPDNVMFTSGGLLKVTDFGLARGQNTDTLTRTGAALGTPHYMSPEQIQSASRGPEIDQYALGIMAFEMLAGKRPFDAEDALQLVFQHLTEEPPDLSELRPEIPNQVVVAVHRMLEKEPTARFPDVREAYIAIEKALASSSVG